MRHTIRHTKKKKTMNPLQITGIAVVCVAVIFACSWFSYSLSANNHGTSSSPDPDAAASVGESTPESTASESSVAPVKQRKVQDTSQSGIYTEASRAIETTPAPTPKTKLIGVTTDIFSNDFVSQSMDVKLEQLKKLFPDGKYWTIVDTGMTQDEAGLSQEEACMIVSDQSCDHTMNGYAYCHEYDGVTLDEYSYNYNIQCLGFASMISDALFGTTAGIYEFYDFDELAIGDHVRFLSAEHSAIVTEKGTDYITVVECNADYEDCMIEWGRTIYADDIINGYYGSYEFLSRSN